MTDAERRPMQRMIATGPRFARKGHGRPQEGGSHASQCHPQPEALQGLQCVVTTEPQKTSCCRAFPEFSEQYARAREAGIQAGIHEAGICIESWLPSRLRYEAVRNKVRTKPTAQRELVLR